MMIGGDIGRIFGEAVSLQLFDGGGGGVFMQWLLSGLCVEVFFRFGGFIVHILTI